MLHDAVRLADDGPVAIRYPRGQAVQVGEHEVGQGVEARLVRANHAADADAVGLLAIGKMVGPALKAADLLAERGVDAAVWDVRCCAPLDEQLLTIAAGYRRVVTVEDGIRDGGVGMTIADRLHAGGADDVTVLGLPTSFLPHDDNPAAILARAGLDPASIADAATA